MCPHLTCENNSDTMQKVQNNCLSPSAERFGMIRSAVNSSAFVTTVVTGGGTGGCGDRLWGKCTAGDVSEQPSEWEKHSDTSTVKN